MTLQNILEGVASLDDLEEKYCLIEFMVFHFEMNMPEEIKMELGELTNEECKRE